MFGCNCQKCFGSLSIDSRYQIYELLKKGSLSVGEVVSFVKLTQPTVTYHLKQMEKTGHVKSYKKGKFVYFEINDTCPQTLNRCILRTPVSITLNGKTKNA